MGSFVLDGQQHMGIRPAGESSRFLSSFLFPQAANHTESGAASKAGKFVQLLCNGEGGVLM